MESKRGWVATNRLNTRQTFGSLFPRDEKMVDAIADHMRINGYDKSQPIVVWDRTEEERNKNALYIVDGHTRKCAAAKAYISSVYAARVKFPNEETALEYAIHNQRDRRNMKDADLTRCIQAVDSRKSRGGDRRSRVAKSKSSSEPIENISSAQQTAAIVGTSETKVKKVRTIIDHANEQTKRDVETGNKTINKAYQETQQKRQNADRPSKAVFNTANEKIDWAKWSWNPVTGCKHGCPYCYARDIANRFYPEKFEPTFHPHRLTAPQNTKIPESSKDEEGIRNVFVCSMRANYRHQGGARRC